MGADVAGPHSPPEVGTSARHELITLQQHSLALRTDKRVDVLVPPVPRAGGSPVLVLLHGFGGTRRTWTDGTQLVEQLRGSDLLVVLPDSGRRWFVNDHAGYRYEDYLIDELVPLIRQTFPVDGRAWAIGGFSMGGASALIQALRHPRLFSVVVSHAGAFEGPLRRGDPYAALRRESECLMPSVQVHERVWGPDGSPIRNTYNPYRLLSSWRSDAQLSVYADVGTGDYQRIIQMNRNIAAALRTAAIDLEYHERPGGHDLSFLDDRLGRSLEFVAERFRDRTGDTGTAEDGPAQAGDSRHHDPSSAPAVGRPGSLRSQSAISRT
jgi:S-formylglutathione hydrolase FrmB